MIGTIDIEVNAANPQMPLRPLTAFVGSPSQVRLRNVPRAVGVWKLTDVRVRANYPDGTSSLTNCTLTGGIWTGTVPATETPGSSLNGFVVEADGDDEHGNRVEGYVLGCGDVEILSRENAVTPGVQTFKGDPGASGSTPVIGPNGNWWIDGEDTGKPARGPKGEPGAGGAVESVNGKTGTVQLTAEDVLNDAQKAAANSGITSDLVPKVLTVDESTATKRIMLDGVAFTSFSALTALVQKGVTRLKYYVTNAASRPVLYTAHLCDAEDIRFDATGYIGTQVFTRSIVIENAKDATGKLTDRIAVTVGTLTEVAKESSLKGKLDKSDGIQEAGSYGLSDGSGVFGFFVREGGGIYIGTATGRIEIPDAPVGNGTLALTSDTKLTPVYEVGEPYSEQEGWLIRNLSTANFSRDPYTNKVSADVTFEFSSDGGSTWSVFAHRVGETGAPGHKGELVAMFFYIPFFVSGYTLGDKTSPTILTDDAKAALFAGADFAAAVEKVFENGDEMEFGGAE